MMILLAILNIILLFILLRMDGSINNKNILLFLFNLYLYILHLFQTFSNLYFSFFQDSFYKSVLSLVAPIYRDLFYVKIALVMTIFGNILTYVGIYIGTKSKNKIFNFAMDNLFLSRYTGCLSKSSKVKIVFKLGLIIYLLGFIVYLIFLKKIGGLFELWQKLHLRTIKNAGLGYLQTFYTYAIQIGRLDVIIWKP